MYKTELICNNCEMQYIIVTKQDEVINFCVFCGEIFEEIDELNLENE